MIDAKPHSPEFMEALKGLHADIAAVIAYGNILPKSVLDAVPMGWYNLHFSNLPKWRGAAPAQRAIWNGDPTTGADVFKVGEGLDDGPIIASLTIELTGRETSGELLARLAEEGAPMYVDALAAVGSGTAVFTPQPAEGLEYAHKITVEDARINWADPAEAIDRQIRACTPHPGAWTELFAEGLIADSGEANEESSNLATTAKSLTLHILAAQPADQTNPNTPIDLDPGELKVGKKNVWVVPVPARWNSPRSRPRQESHARCRLGPRRTPLPRCLREVKRLRSRWRESRIAEQPSGLFVGECEPSGESEKKHGHRPSAIAGLGELSNTVRLRAVVRASR